MNSSSQIHHDTFALIGALNKHFPGQAILPLCEISTAINSWHENGNASGIPPQQQLSTVLSNALYLVVALEEWALPRARAGDWECLELLPRIERWREIAQEEIDTISGWRDSPDGGKGEDPDSTGYLGIILNRDCHTVTRNGKTTELTAKEWDLFVKAFEAEGASVPIKHWRSNYPGEIDGINQLVSGQLNAKLSPIGCHVNERTLVDGKKTKRSKNQRRKCQ